MNIKCVIFDCDGLMFDTETISISVWTEILNAHHVEIPSDLFSRIMGAGEDQIQRVMNEYPKIQALRDEIKKHRTIKAYETSNTTDINKPGLLELLAYLSTTDIKVCVASGSSTEYVKHLISNMGMNIEFTSVIGGDQIKFGKPNPEIFLTSAKIAGIPPENCLVLEDSKNGHIAAKAAGMHRVFIQDMIEADSDMKNDLIEYQFNSLHQVIQLLKNK